MVTTPPYGHKLRSKFRNWINTLLKGTHSHFASYLPGSKGRLATWVLKRFYSGIKENQDQIAIFENLPADAIFIYVNKHKSYFEFLYYHSRYQELELPYPEIGFGYRVFLWQPFSRLLRMLLANLHYLLTKFAWPNPYTSDYYRRELLQGRTAFLSLVEKKDFYRRFIKDQTDPVQYLLEIQKSINRPIYLIPQLMFFGKQPSRYYPKLTDMIFGPEAKPGKLRRLATLFKSPGKIFIETSEPINLKRFIEQQALSDQGADYLSLILRRNLLRQINRHRQSITGPTIKSTEELKEGILTTPRLKEYLDQYSLKRDTPLWKVRKKADGYLDEIAARYSPAFIRFASHVVGWIIDTMFQGVTHNHDGANKIKAMSQKGPLIFVPCHKSHVDYLMLPYLLYNYNMPAPHIAAGKNLSFWPMGPIFRAGGAFFLRRTFRGNVLYAKVFAEYVHKLLAEGFNLKIFIEGTRSRSGKLIMPKLGFLSILLNAFKNGACEDLVFAPIYIGYDRILEETAYIHEVEGGQKEPETLKQVLRARRFLKNRYGRIYIKFHEPISVNRLLADQYQCPLSDLNTKQQNALCRDLGWRIINAINSVTVVTAYGLVSSAILNSSLRLFSLEDLMFDIDTYLNILSSQEADRADTLRHGHINAIRNVLDTYVQRKLINQVSDHTQDDATDYHYQLNVNKRPLLEYYKNNCVSYFIPAAFTALAILEKDAFRFVATELHDSYRFLRSFFKYEFAYNLDKKPDYFIRKSIKAFINDASLVPHQTVPDTYNLTSAGLRKLKSLAKFLKTYFESYWIVLQTFKQNSRNKFTGKDRLKKIQSMGNRLYKRKEIDLPESLSKINYENAINYFTTHEVKGAEDADQIARYEDIIQGYLKLLSS